MYQKYIKRLLDFIISLAALLILSPVLLATAVTVRVRLGSPVIFRQMRPGKKEKIFTLYKFRTMTNASDENGTLLPDAERLTKTGAFLRKSSLDELPELFNILRGDMSLVGPRPLLTEYLPLYSETQRKRHDVRPGLTGLAQVNGRNAISWEKKFEYDVSYAENVSFLLDVKILFRTVAVVFRRDGISSENSVTMEPFSKETEGDKESYE